MKTVDEVLRAKGNQVFTIAATATMHDALKEMLDKNVGALVVKDGDRIVGIVSERDYARRSVGLATRPSECRVGDVMTDRVLVVSPERTIEDCMKLMTDKRVRHLPVMKDEDLAGVVSIGDVVKAVIDEKSFIIEQLENYIVGGR